MNVENIDCDAQNATIGNSRQNIAVHGGSSRLNTPGLHLLLIIVVGLIAYSNSFTVPFLLDDVSFTNTPVIKDLSRFLSSEGYNYNPRRFVGYLTFALNYHFGGMNVFGYHLVNLTIHLLTALLVYLFAGLTFRTPFFSSGPASRVPSPESRVPLFSFIPLFAALLFVAHPIQTQAVTYIVQRLAALATLFYLAALVSYIKARLAMAEAGTRDAGSGQNRLLSGRVIGWFVLSLACTVLAMRTKEIAATLPLVILLYEFSFFGSLDRKKLLLFLVPILLTILIIPIGMALAGKPLEQLLSDVAQQTRIQSGVPRSVYLLTQFSVIATYLRLLILPINQNLDYEYPLFTTFMTPQVIGGFLLICALLGLALWLYRFPSHASRIPLPESRVPSPAHLYRLIAFGIFWFFITLLVESSFIPIVDVIFEHRLYLPTVGIFIATASAASLLLKQPPRPYVLTAAAAIIVALTVATFQRNRVWQSPLALWSDVVAKSPGKVRPHNNLGMALADLGRLEAALTEMKIAITLYPENAFIRCNLANTLNKLGRSDEAIIHLLTAIRFNPAYAPAENNLGIVYMTLNRIDEAITHFSQAVQLDPTAAGYRNSLGAMLRTKGSYEEAIQQLQMAVKLDRTNANAHYNLGMALCSAGSIPLGRTHFEQALRLDPGNQDYRTAFEAARGLSAQ